MNEKKKIIKVVSLVVAVLFIVGAGMRLYKLGEKSMWVDEYITFDYSTRGTDPLKTAHPAYFVLTTWSTKLGESEFFVRLPSAILGALGILGIFLLARCMTNQYVGLIAAGILAFWLNHINYSQEARYYSGMFFYASLFYYFMALLLIKDRWWAWFAAMFIAYLSSLNHPTATVLILGALVFLPLWLILFPSEGKQAINKMRDDFSFIKGRIFRKGTAKPDKKRRKKKGGDSHKKKSRAFYVYLLLFLVFFAVILFLSRGLFRRALFYITNLQFSRTPNVEFTLPFFLEHIRQFTPNIGFHHLLVLVSYLFLLAGFVFLFIRRLSFMFFYLLLVLSTFFAVFTVTFGQTYFPKYIFFITPIFVLAMAYGIWHVSEIISKIKIPRVRPVFAKISFIMLILLLYSVSSIKGTLRFYSLERTDLKGPFKYLKPRMNQNDKILTYQIFDMVIENWEYYARKIGIDRDNLILLKKEAGLGYIGLGQAKKACVSGDDVWYISLWPEKMHKSLRDWIFSNFIPVKTFGSMYGDNTIQVLKWKYSSAFSYYGKPLEFVFDPAPRLNNFCKKFCLDKNWDCRIRATLQNMSAQPIGVSMSIDQTGDNEHTLPPQNSSEIQNTFSLTEGAHSLMFELDEHNTAKSPEVFVKSISITPLIENTYRLEAEEPDYVHPTWNKRTEKKGSIIYLFFKHNYFAEYHFDIPEEGIYSLSVRAKNDKPGPVVIEVVIDDDPSGILVFDRRDNLWETKEFPVKLTGGTHIFTLSFLSDLQKEGSGEDFDNNAYLDYLEIKKPEDPGEVSDQRAPLKDKIFTIRGGETLQILANIDNMIQLSPGWTIVGNPRTEIDKEKIRGKEVPVLHAYIDHDGPGAQVISPAFNIIPGKVLYWSVKMCANELSNHSVNGSVFYLNEQNKRIGFGWASAEGLTGNTDWVRQVFFDTPPPQARKAVVVLNVYKNSKQVSLRNGYVSFADFRIEKIDY